MGTGASVALGRAAWQGQEVSAWPMRPNCPRYGTGTTAPRGADPKAQEREPAPTDELHGRVFQVFVGAGQVNQRLHEELVVVAKIALHLGRGKTRDPMALGLCDLALPEALSGPQKLTPCREEGEGGGRALALGQQLLHPTPWVGACVKGSGTFHMVTTQHCPECPPGSPLCPSHQTVSNGLRASQSQNQEKAGRPAGILCTRTGARPHHRPRAFSCACAVNAPGRAAALLNRGELALDGGGAHPDEVGGDAPPGRSCQLLRGHVL